MLSLVQFSVILYYDRPTDWPLKQGKMKDQDRIREQSISELRELRRRVAELGASVVAQERAEEGLREAGAYGRFLCC